MNERARRSDQLGIVISMPKTPLVLDPKAPFDTAREFVLRRYHQGGDQILYHQGGAFYAWTGDHYPEKDEETLRSELYEFLDDAQRCGEGRFRFKPTRAHVNDILDALKAATHLEAKHCAPAWLGDGPVPANEILACKNGLLHLPTGELIDHSPMFFSHDVLGFEFNPDTPPPRHWPDFLNSLWPEDAESIATLQEIFGLCLTPETRYQKAFMLIGPRRSGKGTIARVLAALIGKNRVVWPTLSSFADQFGLAPLIGKRLACIPDARLGRHANHDKIAERFLSITGEDDQIIDRKYREPWKGRLQVRFLVQSNELPQFDERSGALAGRFIILKMQQSFYGRENLGLAETLLAELPAILNWAIEGWRRLNGRGYFSQPKAGNDLAEDLENLSSPVKSFVKEHCVTGPEHRVEVNVLYNAWRAWNGSIGQYSVPQANLFSRDLYAAYPQIRRSQVRGDDGKRKRVYVGIGLLR
jgi:putative DNA primase/helicase